MNLKIFSRAVSDKELALITRQFAVLLQAGIPLLDTLLEVERSTRNPALYRALQSIRRNLEAGYSLSGALAAHPHIFSGLFVSLVKAGEACGELDQTFYKLSRWLENRVRIRRIILNACLYPLTILIVACVVTLALLFWVIPVFAQLFESLDVPLPAPTRLILSASTALRESAQTLFLTVFSAGLVAYQIRRLECLRRGFDRLLVALPLIGPVSRRIFIARFAGTMATLLSGGVPILSGLKMTAGTIGNSSFEIATRQSIKALARGQSLAGHLERSALFPSFVVELVRAGEKSGQLDEMFNRIARHCEAETETAISILLKLLEPAAVLLAGCFVGGIVASLYLPIFSLTGHLAKQY